MMKLKSLIKGLSVLCLTSICATVSAESVPVRIWDSAFSVEQSVREAFWQIEAKTLPETSPQEKRLTDFKGKPLLVNFWATWCAPCVREMPLLDNFAKENPQINVVGLALDSLKNMQKFGEKVQVSYPLLQLDAHYLKLVKQLGNSKGGLPFTAFFDAEGQIKAVYAGELHQEHLEALLRQE